MKGIWCMIRCFFVVRKSNKYLFSYYKTTLNSLHMRGAICFYYRTCIQILHFSLLYKPLPLMISNLMINERQNQRYFFQTLRVWMSVHLYLCHWYFPKFWSIESNCFNGYPFCLHIILVYTSFWISIESQTNYFWCKFQENFYLNKVKL